MAVPNIVELLSYRAGIHPDLPAFTVDGGGTLSYAEWERASNAVARGLRERGVGRGVRVGLLFTGDDWIEFAVCYLGLLKAGGTALHLSERLDAGEMSRRLTRSEVVGLVHGDDARVPGGFGGWSAPGKLLASEDDAPFEADIRPEDIADVLFTSGTTGPAKGLCNPHVLLSLRRPAVPRDEQAPVVHPLTMGTTASASAIGVAALTAPAMPVVCPADDVERMAALVELYHAAGLLLTPWQAARFVAARVHERHDLSSLRAFNVASAPLPPAVARALLAMAPEATVNLLYTQSEAVPRTVVTRFDPDRPFAVGRPGLLTEVRVVAPDTAEDVPAGEVGEIWISGPGPRRGYLDPSLNAGKYVGEWIRTGDLGWLDEDGVLNFFDRMSDAVSTGAGLVSTVHVEAALYEHPAVLEAAATGRHAGGWASEPPSPLDAFVVVGEAVEPAQLRGWLAARLAAHQVPERVIVLDTLPRGVSGKVLKRVLRDAER